MRGVGGDTRPWLTTAALLLVHDDGKFTSIALDLPLMLDQSFVGLPLLLGRDVLCMGESRFQPNGGVVILDLPEGSRTIQG